MDSFLKKLFGVSPYFIITFPIALVFGLCVAWYLFLSNTTENWVKSDNPLKKIAGWTFVAICLVDYYIWVSTKEPYRPIHDNYPQIFLLSCGIVLSVILVLGFLFALYLVLDARLKGVTLEHRVFVWLGNDSYGEPYTENDTVAGSHEKEKLRIQEGENKKEKATRAKKWNLAYSNAKHQYAKRKYNAIYNEASLQEELWLDDNYTQLIEKFEGEYSYTDEYEEFRDAYNGVTPEPVKKPRKPRAKKVAPPVDDSKVTGNWVAERNSREALRKST